DAKKDFCSENKLQGHLDLARLLAGCVASHLTKVRSGDISPRSPINYGVEGVKHLRPELQSFALRNWELPEDRQVEIVEAIAPENVSSHRTKLECRGNGECRCVKPLRWRRIRQRHIATHVIGTHIAIVRSVGGVPRHTQVEWLPGAKEDNSIDLPV